MANPGVISDIEGLNFWLFLHLVAHLAIRSPGGWTMMECQIWSKIDVYHTISVARFVKFITSGP
jgi:hypothetical protein